MRAIPSALQAKLDSGVTTLARCWIVTRRDGVVSGFTDHDGDLVIEGVTCRAGTGFGASEATSRFDLSIALEGRRIQTRGRVEFTRIDNMVNPECIPGAGIKLLDLQPDAATMIESFFRKRPPLFMVARS